MLGQLNIQLKTPTSPGSQSTNSVPRTPHNLKQLEKQASTIKSLLRHRTQSPSSTTKYALDQLIKGCEIAINGGALLAKENQDLRAAHEKQVQKKKRSTRQIATQEGHSIQEGQSLLQSRNQVEEAIATTPAAMTLEAEQRPVRAPPRCSDCHIVGYRRLQCPNRNSN